MRRLIPLSTLLACGPLTPPADLTSTTDETTTLSTSATTLSEPPPTTTATTTATTATTTDTSTTVIPDFVLPPDIAGPSNKCDAFKQDCPPGQKCTAWSQGDSGYWNATKCVDVTGDGAPGEPCTTPEGALAGIDDCDLGAMCWGSDVNNHGTCIALCTGTPSDPTCPPQSDCYVSEVLNVCIPWCHPLLQDCPGGDLCIPEPDGATFTCVIDDSRDQGQTNDPCEFANSCDPGLVCLYPPAASSACDPASPGCCQPFCKFPGSPCPNPDQQCLQWFDLSGVPTPPGYESVGICAIPT